MKSGKCGRKRSSGLIEEERVLVCKCGVSSPMSDDLASNCVVPEVFGQLLLVCM